MGRRQLTAAVAPPEFLRSVAGDPISGRPRPGIMDGAAQHAPFSLACTEVYLVLRLDHSTFDCAFWSRLHTIFFCSDYPFRCILQACA